MEKHFEALWRRVTDALKPLKKGLVELLGGEEEAKPVPVRVEREVSRPKIEQRRMWRWAALERYGRYLQSSVGCRRGASAVDSLKRQLQGERACPLLWSAQRSN